VFPYPVTDILTIQAPIGMMIESKIVHTTTINFDMSACKAGMYIVKVNDTTKKIIKK
jgi:hypothetical protein